MRLALTDSACVNAGAPSLLWAAKRVATVPGSCLLMRSPRAAAEQLLLPALQASRGKRRLSVTTAPRTVSSPIGRVTGGGLGQRPPPGHLPAADERVRCSVAYSCT
eukprot:359920-Chlamydomonas_euryale.AAC.11